jgi:hypothetical protein
MSLKKILTSFFLIFGLLFGGGQAWAQAYNWKPVVFGGGGYVTGIVLHPNVSGVMYCRTDIGGACRWNPTTSTWTPLLDFLGINDSSYTGVENIALAPENSNRLYMSCGCLSQSQIMISTNQGANFNRVNSPFATASNDGFSTVGNQLELSWPTNHTGWQLQTATQMANPNWVNVPTRPAPIS